MGASGNDRELSATLLSCFKMSGCVAVAPAELNTAVVATVRPRTMPRPITPDVIMMERSL